MNILKLSKDWLIETGNIQISKIENILNIYNKNRC